MKKTRRMKGEKNENAEIGTSIKDGKICSRWQRLDEEEGYHACMYAYVRACIIVLSSSIQPRYYTRIATSTVTTSTAAAVSVQ